MIAQPSSRVNSVRLLLVAFLLVNAPNCHLSLVLSSIVQGDALKQVYHLTEKKSLQAREWLGKKQHLPDKQKPENDKQKPDITNENI